MEEKMMPDTFEIFTKENDLTYCLTCCSLFNKCSEDYNTGLKKNRLQGVKDSDSFDSGIDYCRKCSTDEIKNFSPKKV